MYCPKCNCTIPDDSVVCNVCDEPFAVEQQRGKFVKAKENSTGIISDVIHSSLFLTLAIFMSVLCGISFIYTFVDGFDLIGALVFAFSLVSMIAAWQLYSAKERPDQKKVKRFKMLASSLKIICKVLYITFIVMLAICVLALSFSAAILSAAEDAGEFNIEESVDEAIAESGFEMDDETMSIVKNLFSISLALLIPIFVIVFGLFIAVFVVYTSVFKKTAQYLTDLENTCMSGDYKAEKCPSQFMFVTGIICAAFGVVRLGSATVGLFYGMIGAYLIVLSLVFKKLHALELENNEIINAEEAELARLAVITNEYFRNKKTSSPEDTTPYEDNTPFEPTAPAEETSSPEPTAPTEETSSPEPTAPTDDNTPSEE